jgi:hypothetical protein
MKRLTLGLSMGGLAALTTLFSACGTNEPVNGEGAGGGPAVLDGGAGGRSGAGGRTGAGGGPSASGPVGKECAADGDCAEGLFCMTARSNDIGGGVAGGLCTADCDADPEVCQALDPGAVCIGFTGLGSYCHELCEPGGSPDKCDGRSDLSCRPVAADAAYCGAQCRGDFDCGSRYCDLGSGRCLDELSGTLPMGAPCDPEAETNDCRGGFCLSVVNEAGDTLVSMCSGRCTLGAEGCGIDPTVAEVPAACIYGPATADVGDRGSCGLLCDCNDDCRHPDMVCVPFDDAEIEQSTGHVGVCSVRDDGSGVVEPGVACAIRPPDAGPPPADSGPRPDGGGTGRDAAPAADAAPTD